MDKSEKVPEKIRLGNFFVDDFIFDDSEAADIPINALRVIFNLISTISNEQFRPQDRPKQLSLFDEEFETENNIFASIKIKNSKISPSGSTKQVIDAYEFLAKFKMGWYKSVNSKGKEIKTFGGLISTPSYDKRGYTTFLVSSYWLKKLLVIPEYNYVLYNLVYNVRNNKHIIFAIWLSKLPENGTVLKLSTLNKKFGLNYRTTKDFCFKFLKPARISLNTFNTLSFNYTYNKDSISIIPFLTKGGHVGVDIFFVLSGFLITSILISMNYSSFINLSLFYKKRALRLLPALFFFIVFSSLGLYWSSYPYDAWRIYEVIVLILFTFYLIYFLSINKYSLFKKKIVINYSLF